MEIPDFCFVIHSYRCTLPLCHCFYSRKLLIVILAKMGNIPVKEGQKKRHKRWHFFSKVFNVRMHFRKTDINVKFYLLAYVDVVCKCLDCVCGFISNWNTPPFLFKIFSRDWKHYKLPAKLNMFSRWNHFILKWVNLCFIALLSQHLKMNEKSGYSEKQGRKSFLFLSSMPMSEARLCAWYIHP